MATTASRINNTGTYFINGNFDEITGTTVKVSANTVYARSFDEVTYSSTTPAFKNLLTYTEQFDNAYWTKTRSSIGVTNTIAAPDGTLTAEKFIEDTSVSLTHYINGPSLGSYVTATGFPTASIYVKAGERTYCTLYIIRDNGAGFATSAFVVNLTDGSIVSGTGTVYSVGNGWYRLSVTATSTGANYALRLLLNQDSTTTVYTGDGTSGLYIWGAQLESNPTTTIYQGVGAANTLVPTSFIKREDNTGTTYVKDKFDEVTGTIVTNGLVAYYDAGKAASQPATGATWYDISDRRNNATPSASPPTFNSAGYFTLDRVNSQRYFSSALAPTTWAEPWSIEVWMYTPTGATWSNGTNTSHFISVGSTAGTWGVVRSLNDNQVTTWIRGAAEQVSAPSATLTRDRWHQYVGTWNGSNIVSSYLNGVFVGSATISPTGTPDIGSISIGGTNNTTVSGAPGICYEGNIATVMMYNRALTAAEVTNNFEALRGRFGI